MILPSAVTQSCRYLTGLKHLAFHRSTTTVNPVIARFQQSAFAVEIVYFLAEAADLTRGTQSQERVRTMSVARVTEITSSSTKSFEDAIQVGISRANKTLQNVKGAWIQDQKVVVENGKITEYRVNMKVTFVLKA